MKIIFMVLMPLLLFNMVCQAQGPRPANLRPRPADLRPRPIRRVVGGFKPAIPGTGTGPVFSPGPTPSVSQPIASLCSSQPILCAQAGVGK